jgi:putative DNA primase/helicase
MDPRWGLIEAYIADLGPVFRLRGKVPGGVAEQPWDEYTAFTVADIPTVFPLGGTWNMGLRVDLCPGLIVLDVDAVKHPDSAAAFAELSGIDPADDADGNCRVMTGNATPDGEQLGRHFYFQASVEEIDAHGWKSKDRLYDTPGLDVKVSHLLPEGRRAQCYVVLPGSVHPESRKPYELASPAMRPEALPPEIREYLDNGHKWKPERKERAKPSPSVPLTIAPATVALGNDDMTRKRFARALEGCTGDIQNAAAGQRQEATNRAAYKLGYLTQNLPESMRAEALRSLQTASDARMSDADLAADQRKAVGDVERAFRDGASRSHDGTLGDPIGAPSVPDPIRRESPPRADEAVPEESASVEPFRIFSPREMREWPAPVEVIAGMVCEGDLFGIVAPYSSGKSALALDIALHVATGTPWQDRAVAQSGVVYVAAENAPGYVKRLAAWGISHGTEVEDLPFRIVTAPMKLDGGIDALRLCETVNAASEQMGERVGWIVIDTVRRTMGGEENRSDHFQAYVDACDMIRTATGAVVNLVHHSSSKGENPTGRGSSVWGDALAPIISVKATPDPTARTLTISCRESSGAKPPKDLEPFDDITMHLVGVDIGTLDPHGNPVTAVVVGDGFHPRDGTVDSYLSQVRRAQAWIRENPGMGKTKLRDECISAQLGITNTTRAGQLIDRMVADGYLSRDDRRGAPVEIGPALFPDADTPNGDDT